MKRFLAFMFGLIFGVVFLLGTFGIAVYSSLTVVHPNEIYTDIESYLGDLGDVSLLQAYYNILDLYNSKTGNLTNQELYSVGDFLADNHISSTGDDGQTTAFGIVLPKELLDAPLFEYFNTNVDENGHTGVQRALKQIKLSAVPSIVNTFATPDQNGQPVVSEEVIAELDNHSVFDLVYGENQIEGLPNIVGNLAVVMENITLADLVPSLRNSAETENILKNLLLAVGKAPIGKLIADLTGDKNILGMLNEDGALYAVGQLTICDILGDDDALISGLLGNIAIADLVSESGELAIVDVLDSISIAGLLGIVKRTADVDISPSDITTYYQTNDDGSNGPLIWSVGVDKGNYYISLNYENDAISTTWYEGQLVCDDNHDHTANCFDYMWYALCKQEHDHTGEYIVATQEGSTAYTAVATTSINYTLANLKLGCLFDETGAISIDNLVGQFDKHTVEQILQELLAHNEILDKVSALLELDGMTLSNLLADGGIDQLLNKVTDKPLKDILETFGVTGLDFVTDIVGDMSINQLIAGGYEDISLYSLLGLVKNDVTKQITQQDGSLLDSIVACHFTTTTEETTVFDFSIAQQLVGENQLYYICTNYDPINQSNAVWYQAQLVCQDVLHTQPSDHTRDCFEYILYQKCTNEDTSHDHATEDAFAMEAMVDEVTTQIYYVPANSLFNTLGNMTIGKIINGGFETLFDELLSLRLADLFDMLGLGQMEGVLETLSKFTIKELMEGGYNSLSIGDLLGYKRYLNNGSVDQNSIVALGDLANADGYIAMIGTQLVISTDSENWYNGKLACKQEHIHTIDCYEYLWYGACDENCNQEHEHLEIGEKMHTLATGIFGLLVDVTIQDITTNPNSLLEKLFDIKLKELLGADLEGLMATIGEFSINDLLDPSTLDSLGIGDILSYIKNDITQQVATSNQWVDVVTDNGTAVVKANADSFAMLDTANQKWYKAQLHCNQQHPHQSDCFGYIWYEKCTTATCSAHAEHFAMDATQYGSISGLYAVLADLTIGSLTGGADILETLTNRLTLGDIFGDNIPEMLSSLKDTPIANLSSAIETTKVGDLLGYTYNQELSRWEKNVGGTMQELTGIEKVLADKTINQLKDFDEILNDVTLGDVLNPIPDMFASLADIKVTELGTEIEKLKVGDLLGYTYNQELSRWEKNVGGTMQVLTGIEKVLANKTISDLKDFNSILDEVTLGDVLGDNIPDMLKTLADTKVAELGTELEKLKVGDLLGYTYNQELSRWEKDVSGTMQELTGIEKVLANKTISDLKNFNSILDEVTLGDVLGDGIPSMLSKLKDTPITQIGTQIDSLVVGDFLGYAHVSVDITDANWIQVVGIDGLYMHKNGTFALESDGKHYIAQQTCDQTEAHTNACYSYKWYTKCPDDCTNSAHVHAVDTAGNTFVAVVGITAKLADKTINQLSNLSDLMNDLTLTDVFGEGNVPTMLQSIADQKIANLQQALNSIYVGDFLGYEKGERILVCTNDDLAHQHIEDMNDANCCYQKKLACTDKSHTHSTMCYIYCYEWMQLACNDISHNHSVDTTPSCYQQVGGITGKIANERLDTLSDIGQTIKTFTLRDVLGEDIPSMLKGIADTPIGQLDSALDNLYLGEILSYSKHPAEQSTIEQCTTVVVENIQTNTGKTHYIMLVDGVWYDAVVACTDTTCLHNDYNCYGYLWYDGEQEATGITAKLANQKVSQLGNLGQTIQTFSLYDVLGDSVPSMLESIKHQPINNLSNAINDIYLGEFLGYTKGEIIGQTLECNDDNHTLPSQHTDECYYNNYNWLDKSTTVDGMMAKIANKKISNLGTISDDITSFTFAEIMGRNEGDNAIIKELYDTPVSDIGTKMNDIMLGTAMGYYRKEISAGEYQTDANGKYIWYTDTNYTTTVSAPQSAFVNSTLQNIGGDIGNITLGELIEIDKNSSAMLQALKSTPINNIAGAIDTMALGTSMGFVRLVVDDSTYTTTVIEDNGNVLVKTDGVGLVRLHDGKWYQAVYSCNQTHDEEHKLGESCYGFVWYEKCEESHEHLDEIVIDGQQCKQVGGLNAQMANLTVRNMGGQAIIDIVTSLSVKDMIDSGILGFEEEEKFKLAILFTCNDGSKECNLTNFMMAKMMNSSLTAESYFTSAHGHLSPEELIAHRDQWQNCTLTEFISTLLGGI